MLGACFGTLLVTFLVWYLERWENLRNKKEKGGTEKKQIEKEPRELEFDGDRKELSSS